MTSTVFPDLAAQAAAAALTALVSASPELPIITVSLTGGVLVVLGSTASAWIATGQPTDTGGKAES